MDEKSFFLAIFKFHKTPTNVQEIICYFSCVLFYSSFVCIYAYANVYFKTTIIKQNMKIILLAGVPSSQALPGFLITAPPSVCVPDVIGTLACGFQTKKKRKWKYPGLDVFSEENGLWNFPVKTDPKS